MLLFIKNIFQVPKTVVSLLYAYLIATKKVNLPVKGDNMLCDDSTEITETLNLMFEIINNEKSFMKDVTNATIIDLKQKDAIKIQEHKEKLDININQRKKLKVAKNLKTGPRPIVREKPLRTQSSMI